ncbi:excalibur calcium-binding domain-containing protein [Novosphingopyxis sp.]|uniref:excalibur calcium-binding domain-containing protein n=1 Tax=Novosphingopyxis sp. TaxID=2709690 RepID=UPI003B58B555
MTPIAISSMRTLFTAAAIIGVIVGVGSVATTPEGRTAIRGAANEIGIASGMLRRRAPQPGDYLNRCSEARAAGTAPINHGEPGYRPELDGDDDGIACEPYRR